MQNARSKLGFSFSNENSNDLRITNPAHVAVAKAGRAHLAKFAMCKANTGFESISDCVFEKIVERTSTENLPAGFPGMQHRRRGRGGDVTPPT
jgi:hypothetical protein